MVIIISGPTGSGKSTTALMLKKRLRRLALVELDFLRDFIPQVPINQVVPIVIDMGILVTKKLLQENYNVVIVYPLYDRHFQKIKKSFRRWPVMSFVLSPQKRIIQPGRGKRRLIPWEKKRIAFQYRTGLNNPKFGIKIDNTSLKPSQVVKLMLQYVPASVVRK